MSLLAPLYVAGLLAIALPILFHLIRRAPQGRQDFSSLMFLTVSPPTLTRRSRLTNILLLILRAAALAILAFAFARPFFREEASASVGQGRGRKVAILIDTSASMSRGDLAQQARAKATEVLGGLTPANDEVAVYAFDRDVRPVTTFEDWNHLSPGQRVPAVTAQLASVAPTSDAGRIGNAIATAADLLAGGSEGESARGAAEAKDAVERQVVLISDLQRGGRVEALQRHEWPQGVTLRVLPVSPKGSTNASMQLVKEADGDSSAIAPAADATRLRVRVSNEPGASAENFSLAWADAKGPIAGEPPFKVYVAPGRSQVVRVPWPAPDKPTADRVVLTGDDFDFDNALFVVPPRKDSVRVLYLGDDSADDVKGLLYYAKNALADTPRRGVEFLVRRSGERVTDSDMLSSRLAIVAGSPPLADDRLPTLRRFIESGGDVLWVLSDVASAGPLERLVQAGWLGVAEAEPRDYALLSRVEFDHPLFAPFAEARFADFSRIHFWKHRRVTIQQDRPGVRVVARFDNGDPFLIEHALGRGRLMVLSAGWHPADSQLALSTKFVPLMEGLVRRRDVVTVQAQHVVHDEIALPKTTGDRVIVDPAGTRVQIAASSTTFPDASRPGVWKITTGTDESQVAVNLSPDESRTAPVAVEELEQYGVRLAKPRAGDGGSATAGASSQELAQRERRLAFAELENRQKLWRWLIAGVLVLLAAETFLAGRLARRESQPAPAADDSTQQAVTT